MSKPSNTKIQKRQNLIDELKTLEDKKFTSALEGLKSFGDNSVIAVFAAIYPKCSSSQQHQLTDFLADIRDEESQDTLMDVLMELEDVPTRIAFLSTVWNSTVDYSDYLFEFVKIAIEGSVLELIECHTIIDNLEGPFDEDIVLEATVLLKENLEVLMQNADKRLLINDIMLKLEEFDQSVES